MISTGALGRKCTVFQVMAELTVVHVLDGRFLRLVNEVEGFSSQRS
jgi:hypothetical protein